MDEEIVRIDPYSKSKKTTVAVFVGVVGLLAIIAFLVFGKLLRDFLVFDANRTQAVNELTILHSRIKEQENRLNTQRNDFAALLEKGKTQALRLDEDIAKREAHITSQEKLMQEYTILTEKISYAKKEYQSALDDLNILLENAAIEKGTVSALKKEINTLATQKSSMQNELAELGKTKKIAEQSIKDLSDQITNLETMKSAAETEISETKKAVAEISADLSNRTTRVENTRKTLSRLEEEVGKVKMTHDTFSAQRTLAQEKIKAKTTEKEELVTVISELTQRKAELSEAIAALEKRKEDIETQAKAVEMRFEQTNIRLQAVNKKTEAVKADN